MNGEWVAGYFQVAVSILVVGVGLVTSVITQTTIPEDLRQVIRRQFRLFTLTYLLTAVYIACSLAIVWFIRPGSSTDASGRAAITVAIVLLVPVWLLQTLCRWATVLRFVTWKGAWQIRRKGHLAGPLMNDLGLLGRLARDSGERARVLDALESLGRLAASNPRYKGNQLGGVVTAIVGTVRSGPDAYSLDRGVSALRQLSELPGHVAAGSSADTAVLLRALGALAVIAAADDDPSTLKILGAIGHVWALRPDAFPHAASALSELGGRALATGRYPLAVLALGKLEAFALVKQPLDADSSMEYLGLIARFWNSDGAARKWASSTLRDVSFKPSRVSCLRQAEAAFMSSGRFDAANELAKMIASGGAKG